MAGTDGNGTAGRRGDISPIHTLNARGHGMLEAIRDHYAATPADMMAEIQAIHRDVVDALRLKNMRYEDLRSALVPSQTGREIALVFDSTAIDDDNYGRAFFELYMPLFDPRSDHSVLDGDYGTLGNEDEPLLAEAFQDAVRPVRPVIYRHSSQFYLVYINNLTAAMIERFDTGLRASPAYVGYADMTYGSTFKFLVSTMLPLAFIKLGRTILQGHEDDVPNDEDSNLIGWPFDTFGYGCRSIQLYLIGILLTFKIERPVFESGDADTQISLNAISETPLPLGDFTIEADDAKTEYLRSAKSGSLARAGLADIDSATLSRLIGDRIRQSYIYRLEYKAEFNVAKFNIILEVPGVHGPTRLLAALEYQPATRTLRLITLF